MAIFMGWDGRSEFTEREFSWLFAPQEGGPWFQQPGEGLELRREMAAGTGYDAGQILETAEASIFC